MRLWSTPKKLISARECDKMSRSLREPRTCRHRTFLCWKRGLLGRNFNPGRFPQGEQAQGLISADTVDPSEGKGGVCHSSKFHRRSIGWILLRLFHDDHQDGYEVFHSSTCRAEPLFEAGDCTICRKSWDVKFCWPCGLG